MSQIFAHPVLAPWSSDYVQPASFTMETGESVPADLSTNELAVPITYRLECFTLESMISRGLASYAVLVTSPRTMVRQIYKPGSRNPHDETIVLKMSEFAHQITLTPYVISTKEVILPVTDEHDVEFHEAGRTEFKLASSTILAIGDGVRLSHGVGKVTSIIDIVPSRRVTLGHFMIDYEDTRIKVLVNPEDERALKRMRTGSPIARATLHPGLYLHAVAGAISKLPEHRDSAWASVVVSALESQGLGDLDYERMGEDPHIYAQMLLEAPLGYLLRMFEETSDDS